VTDGLPKTESVVVSGITKVLTYLPCLDVPRLGAREGGKLDCDLILDRKYEKMSA
jgi:hypothetical protein